MAALTFDNRVFANFALVSTAGIIKMHAMSALITRLRMKRGIFVTPEDLKLVAEGQGKETHDDPLVERIRRIHLNDVENIPPFVLVGFFYVLSDPPADVSIWHFRVFALARFLHSVCYRMEWQPYRSIFYCIGWGTTLSMAGQVIKTIFTP